MIPKRYAGFMSYVFSYDHLQYSFSAILHNMLCVCIKWYYVNKFVNK